MGFSAANLVCKWKRKYRGWTADEAWFILSNLNSLDESLKAYQKRFGIEEMFRDFKSGGYNLEGTKVSNKRLMTLMEANYSGLFSSYFMWRNHQK